MEEVSTSKITVSGKKPFSKEDAYTKGLKEEPGCLFEVITLNSPFISLSKKSLDPTIDKMSPVLFSITTDAMFSRLCVSCIFFALVFNKSSMYFCSL